MSNINAHAKPPDAIKVVYKRYQKLDDKSLAVQPDLIDLASPSGSVLKSTSTLQLPQDNRDIFLKFLGQANVLETGLSHFNDEIYEITNMPGLYLYPTLLPQPIQVHLLDTLLLRDLNNPLHKTNIHTHYHIPYPPPPTTFFHTTPTPILFPPKDPTQHKPLTTLQFLTRKLRWMTLGSQYDWTQKSYPSTPPPPFPPDSKHLLESLFPMKAEAAIVNLYTPGDTLSLHRDVSEECNRPLASVSIGCDAVFVVGLDEGRVVTIRLRSGDALLMSGECRYAWHGVPKIVEGTCPAWLEDWPYRVSGDGVEEYGECRGWMRRKRINLNVRQMFENYALAI